MLATTGSRPFTSADWLYEIKFGAYRCSDEIGRSGFEKLYARSRRRWCAGCDAVTFCAFNLLVHDGEPCICR